MPVPTLGWLGTPPLTTETGNGVEVIGVVGVAVIGGVDDAAGD